MTLAFCWAHVRRRFYDRAVAEARRSPTRRCSASPRSIGSRTTSVAATPTSAAPCARRRSRPIVAELEPWLREKLALFSQKSKLAQAIRYGLSRWDGLVRFLDDGRVEIDSNTVERSIRPLALTRKNALFAGSDDGASYCSSRHVLISQRDFSDDRQTAGVAISERWLRGEQSRAPSRRGGLSRARPCMAGSRIALVRRSNDARLTY